MYYKAGKNTEHDKNIGNKFRGGGKISADVVCVKLLLGKSVK